MHMDRATALQRLRHGEDALRARVATVQFREKVVRGNQPLPFAPTGVADEYLDLREQAIANYLGIAMHAPIQRLRADGLKTGMGADADKALWRAWQGNKMDNRQSLPYLSMMMHGRGIASVWPNKGDKSLPIIRPESYELVHLEMDPDDPFTALYAVKLYEIEEASTAGQGLILPGSTRTKRSVGIVYDNETIWRFERGGLAGTSEWQVVLDGTHPMKKVPFALYDYRPDTQGRIWSALDQLIPQQNAVNTIRFNILLAMQFSAFRQRVVTGFDPRMIDANGNIVYEKNPDNTLKVDAKGRPIPVLNTPGRVGVDRMLVFPGAQTKVFDLQESNLDNYVKTLDSFLVQFFSTAQLPPQYLLAQLVNISGDALSAAESTLASLVMELQLAAAEGNETVSELAWYAMGETKEFPPTIETQWADAEARSFAQIVDAIVKLISQGFPKRAAFGLIPGATQTKVDDWMDQAEDEAFANRMALAARPFVDATGPRPLPAVKPITDQTQVGRGDAANFLG